MKNRKKCSGELNKERKTGKIDYGFTFIEKLEIVLSAIFTTFFPIICVIVVLLVTLYKYFTN